MSLNPDQPKAFSPPRDGLQFSTGSNPNPTPTHQNLHSSSGSPGFAFPPNESSNQLSGHLPRGQRSHSASTFQSVLRRIDSVHGENESLDHTRANSYRTQRVVGVELGSRSGRKSGKSSGSSSVDLGQMAAPSRFQQSLGRRSASFDQGDRIHIIHSVSSSTTQPQSLSGRSQPNNYDDLEAAPTPTVPGGPRKDRSLAFPQMNGQAAPQGPTPQRRNSNKSSKSYAGRKKKGDAVLWDTAVPPNGNAHVATRRGSKQSPPMPGFIRPRNGSPARQYSEPLMAQRVNSTSHSKDVIKERPGFFRRVFGSSKGQLPTTGDLHSSQLQPSNASCGANSRERTTALHGAPRWAITDDFSHPLPDANQLPLAKKPSSFFRRRKKSVSENMPPSMFPLHVQTTAPPVTDSTQESPVSSLRQVMNPYLDDPMRSNAQQFAGTTTTLQAKGSIEPIHKSYDAGNDASLNNPLRQAREAMTSRRETLTERVHLQPNNSTSSKPADNSFLHDDSSNETRIPGAIYEAQFGRHDNTKLDQTPVSLSPSLTSNKENTRSRSKYKESPESSYIRSIDSPRSRNMPSTRNDKLPASPRAAHATPVKSGARDWLTPSLKPGKSQVSPPSSPKGSDRVWLQPNHTDSTVRKLETPVSAEGEVSPVSDYHSASSVINPGKVNDDIHFPEPTAEDAAHKLGDDKDIDRDLPTEADRAQAKQLYEGDESQVSNVTAAAWLGEPRPDRMRIRRAYVELFDWRDLNILAALRGLCGKLYLKGEAQQVDRVLDAFSNRWCACNPNHGFKATGMLKPCNTGNQLMRL